jgi:hypothetical protein
VVKRGALLELVWGGSRACAGSSPGEVTELGAEVVDWCAEIDDLDARDQGAGSWIGADNYVTPSSRRITLRLRSSHP